MDFIYFKCADIFLFFCVLCTLKSVQNINITMSSPEDFMLTWNLNGVAVSVDVSVLVILLVTVVPIQSKHLFFLVFCNKDN